MSRRLRETVRDGENSTDPPPWVSRDGLQSQQDQQKRGVMSNEAHIQLNGYQMCREENGKTGVDPECVCVPYDGVKLT